MICYKWSGPQSTDWSHSTKSCLFKYFQKIRKVALTVTKHQWFSHFAFTVKWVKNGWKPHSVGPLINFLKENWSSEPHCQCFTNGCANQAGPKRLSGKWKHMESQFSQVFLRKACEARCLYQIFSIFLLILSWNWSGKYFKVLMTSVQIFLFSDFLNRSIERGERERESQKTESGAVKTALALLFP